MSRATIIQKLPCRIKAGLSGFFRQNYNDLVFDLTGLNRLNPAIFSKLLQNQDDRRYGINLVLKQPAEAWSLDWLKFQWAAGYSFDNLATPSTLSEKYDAFGAVLESLPLSFDGEERDIHSFFVQTKISLSLYKYIFHFINGGRVYHYSDFGTQFAPRAGFIFQPDKRSAFKVLYGQSFRAPTGAELYGAATARGNPDLEPDEIDSFEFVSMHTWDYEAFPEYIFNCGFGMNWEGPGISFYVNYRVHLEVKEGPVWDTIADPDELPLYYRADLNINKMFSDSFTIELNVHNLFSGIIICPLCEIGKTAFLMKKQMSLSDSGINFSSALNEQIRQSENQWVKDS